MTIGSKTLSEQEIFDYGLNFIRLRLFTIPGLATPAPFGGKLRQIMVDIDPARVAAKGLSPNDVVQTVLQSNVLVPAGSAQIGGTRYDVQLNSSPDTVQGFNELPVKAMDGATVLLGDVARVRDGFAVQENVVRLNGRRATYLAILKKADASTLAVVEGAREQIPIIQQAAPEGMELKLDFDQSVFVRAAIVNVLHEAVIASILVSLIASYILSRTLVPMLARLLMEKEDLHYAGESFGARFNRWRDGAFGRFQETYGRVLQTVLQHRSMVLGAAGLILLFTAALPFVVGLDFFPNVDAGQMRLHFRAPIGTRLEETERLVARLEQRLQDIIPPSDLATINSNIGMPTSYNLAFVQTDNTGSQDADILIALQAGHAPTEQYMEKIRRELPDEFPGSSLYFQPADIVSQVLNFGLSAPIDVQIDGPDVEQSYALARNLAGRIRLIPGASDVRIPQV